MKKLILTLLLGALIFTVSAQVPKTLSFQGYLTDAAGEPVTSTPDMTFYIFDALSGGNQLWTEIHSAVPVTKGLYNVLLGDAGTPIVLPFDKVYYLQVKVGTETLTPRITVSSSAYSLSSINASTITNGSIANSLLDADLQDLADGSLSGTVVGSGINAANITTGTIADARLETTVDLSSLTVGASQFVVSNTGNITKLNNVTYSFPATQGGANSFLTNNSSGTLTWATILPGSQVGTGINASNITSGTLSGSLVGSGMSAANITGTLAGSMVGSGINASNITTGTLNGALVGTGIDGTDITTGTLADARLEAAIDRTTFNASGNVTAGGYVTAITGLHVGSAAAPTSGNLEVEGYAKLGSGAPVIQLKKITGTTDPTQGNEVVISHGLTVSKIISITAIVESTAGVTFIPAGFKYAGGFEFYVYLSGANLRVATVAANSGNVVNKPFRVLITYEQ